jgi:molybdenum cofactor cytidylyltransferase/nicotine blue oxidoreductase
LSETSVAAAVLAAGRGSRLGGDAAKPLLEWRGRPLVAWAVDAALGSDLRPLVVVVGYRGDEVRAALADSSRAPRSSRTPVGVDTEMIVVENPDWEEGIASSVRAALVALTPIPTVDAVCIGLADQPMVGVGAYRRLAAHPGSAPIAAAVYGGEPGNPVKLARNLWGDALQLRGDVGARALMRDHPVDLVECGDTGSADDVDTLEDLERLPDPEEKR